LIVRRIACVVLCGKWGGSMYWVEDGGV